MKLLQKLILITLVTIAFFVSTLLVKSFQHERAWYNADFAGLVVGTVILEDGKGPQLYNEDSQKSYYNNLLEGRVRTDNEFYSADSPDRVELMPYRLVPINALLLKVLYKGDPHAMYMLFALINVGVALLISHVLSKGNPRGLFYSVILLLIYIPFFFSMTMGQFTIIVTLGISLCYVYLKRNKEFLAGLFLGTLVLKTHLLILIPFISLLSKDKKRFLLGSVVLPLFALINGFLVVGPTFVTKYLNFVLHTEGTNYGSHLTINYSLQPIITLFTQNAFLWILLLISSFVALYVLLSKDISNKKHSDEMHFLLALLSGILVAWHIYPPDLIILFPALYLLLMKYFNKGNYTVLSLLPILFFMFLFAHEAGIFIITGGILNPLSMIILLYLGYNSSAVEKIFLQLASNKDHYSS